MSSSFRLRLVSDVLFSNGVIAYPTDTIFGLGCLPDSDSAIQQILAIKKRSPDMGLVLVANRIEYFAPYLAELSDSYLKTVVDSTDLGVTWLAPAAESCSGLLTGAHSTIAIRLTNHAIIASLCDACDSALVSTSVNHHGKPALNHALTIRRHFADEVDTIIAGQAEKGRPSRIVNLLTQSVERS